MTLPTLPLPKLFNLFPLYSYPLPPAKSSHDKPTLWIVPPGRSLDANANSGLLSANVECLKWQAYIALRGVKNIAVRWDMAPEGALDGRLPNLHVPAGADTESQLLKAQDIPAWVDSRVGSGVDTLQGFKDERMRDESHAWVSLLEGVVHAALTLLQPTPSLLCAFTESDWSRGPPIQAVLNPPPAPLTGFSSLFPSFGTNVTLSALQGQYTESITALSERLGTDTWLLGSENPTALDALLFAYLHCILHSPDVTRFDVARRHNLVDWERKVRTQIQDSFCITSRD